MNPRSVRGAVICCVTFFFLVSGVFGQEKFIPNPNGFPQDWSSQNVVFSHAGLAKHPDLLYSEPRLMLQVQRHSQLPNFGAFEPADATAGLTNRPVATQASIKAGDKTAHDRDWAFALPGHMIIDTYPAKFGFYPNTPPSCTGDFVVYGLTDSNNANLVALNNLYSSPTGGGFCDPATGPGTGPTVLFAYNITTVPGGHIITSPVLSFDGTKVAFVESIAANGTLVPPVTAQCVFHVVPTNGGGTLPGGVPLPGFTLQLSSSANDTHSSPWIDYVNDVVYVGTDDGFVHQITGVFKGTPTLDPSAPFPVTTGPHPTSPVLDENLGILMVGSADGNLYEIDTTSGAVAALQVGTGPGSGIVAPPVVDVIDGTTFAVTANDGFGSAAIMEASTVTDVQVSFGELGQGNANGTVTPTLNIYQPVFSNSYYNNPTSGVLTVCGTAHGDATPYQYVFGFIGDHMIEAPLFSQPLGTSTNGRCTGWSEIFNPNIPTGGAGTDYFFFGITEDCIGQTPTGTAASGCVGEETNLTPTAPPPTPLTVLITGGPSGIIFDNYVDPIMYPQASSIYFTALRVNDAYKLTQDGLQ